MRPCEAPGGDRALRALPITQDYPKPNPAHCCLHWPGSLTPVRWLLGPGFVLLGQAGLWPKNALLWPATITCLAWPWPPGPLAPWPPGPLAPWPPGPLAPWPWPWPWPSGPRGCPVSVALCPTSRQPKPVCVSWPCLPGFSPFAPTKPFVALCPTLSTRANPSCSLPVFPGPASLALAPSRQPSLAGFV